MNKKIIVAIDGYSGTGKSSTAKYVAGKLNYTYIDSGAMYRAITLHLLREKIPLEDLQVVENTLKNIHITFTFNEKTQTQHTLLNGEDVENEIRKMYVSKNVSQVSKIASVRKSLVAQQQLLGKKKAIVMDGRDIGTVVFPEAELKVFMTADVKVRAERRQKELEEKTGSNVSLESIIDNLKNRDAMDTSRKESPLKKAEDALELDSTNLSFVEQCEKIVNWANQRITFE